MSFIKKVFGNKNFVTFIAGLACIIILFFAYRYRIKQLTNPVSVPYAVQDIPARTEITEKMIDTVKVASSMITDNVITSKSSIVGKYVNYNTFVPAGSLFYSAVLVNWESMPDSAWSNVITGNTLVSLPVSTTTTYGNSIYPGDKIDLYYKSVDTNGKLLLGSLIKGIEVIAVKDKNGNHIFKKSSSQQEASALIFSVPESYHLLLRKAMYLDGEIIPVPRNSSYDVTTTIGSEYLKNFILSKTQCVVQNNADESYCDVK